MRGYPNYNREEFHKAEAELDGEFKVLNPAHLDEMDAEGNLHTQHHFVARDVDCLLKSTHIYMLKGHEKSVGATAELAVARWLGLTELYQDKASVAIIAERLVNGDRGEAYGHPYDDFSKTSGMLNALGYKGPHGEISQADIPVIMTCVKLSRMTKHKHNNHKDSIVDTIGYMLTLEKCLDRIKGPPKLQ